MESKCGIPCHVTTGLTWFQRDCSYMPGVTAFKPLNLYSALTLHLLVTVEPLFLLASIGEKCTFLLKMSMCPPIAVLSPHAQPIS